MVKTRVMGAALAAAALMVAGSACAQMYLRAEVGHSEARKANFRDDVAVGPNCFVVVVFPGVCGAALNELGSATLLGAALGMPVGRGFRGELAFSIRRSYGLSGVDPAGTLFEADLKSEALMLNGFYDLPVNWGRVKPFVGAGIGVSRNKLGNINWFDPAVPVAGVLPGGSTTQLAWQVTAGAAINIAPKWNLDIAYRYFDMGKFKKNEGADIVPQFNPSGITGPATGKLRADEISLSLRYQF